MYHHLHGKICSVLPGKIVIETGGVGYELFAPLSTTGKIRAGADAMLLTHLIVRDDALILYAFLTEDERRLFRKLVSLSGIGAATAAQILSAATPEEFLIAIEKQDAGFLQKIKGIGEKTAKRIILELKGAKMDLAENLGKTGLTGIAADAALALETLGLSGKEAVSRVEKTLRASPHASLENIVAAALRDK